MTPPPSSEPSVSNQTKASKQPSRKQLQSGKKKAGTGDGKEATRTQVAKDKSSSSKPKTSRTVGN